ncbi:hypothetical protein [Rhodoferax sp.]|uniref:hypothetical protein n=1 Tax=Rhodoferax sp. TaxID=50421 RepID=UPI002ACDDAAB|nr:hypothetical protein [Rhodoferax sp.]MDZ7919292.1 hypothetical protein [Rhodoferax sp.]
MNLVSQVVSAVLRTVLKLALLAAALVFITSLLIVGLLSLVLVLLKALLTGRKPVFVTTFQRFNQARQQFKQGGWRAGPAGAGGFAPGAGVADVVDVQAHEVRDEQALPYGTRSDKS